jgi:hypothetical protein
MLLAGGTKQNDKQSQIEWLVGNHSKIRISLYKIVLVTSAVIFSGIHDKGHSHF